MADLTQFILDLSVRLPAILAALTCHEYAHGWVADKRGDPTARWLGRLTWNPLAHLDPVGTLALIFTPVGWAKPVPVNFDALRHPRRDMVLVAAAGPGANLILAFVCAWLLRLFGSPERADEGAWFLWLTPVSLMLYKSVLINVALAVFNLIPVLPLDGGRVMAGLLPPRQAASYGRLERYGFVILIVLIFSGAVDRLIWPPIALVAGLLLGA
ncbi:MAG: site-2 protease family protein [Candidatus Methylomirabilota bacterium]|nr:site-2 protease family protein [Candidatus Methylomirabilis sp.]NJD68741.1 site-2 protease family protein [candidate division NC10 bacterium]PWB43012.1 MAG: site-2 protease family protein [candidate division NC10 bacterium]